MTTTRDGVLEDWPRPQGHLKDKILWPWPRRLLALASTMHGLGFGLVSKKLMKNSQPFAKKVKMSDNLGVGGGGGG